MSTDSAVDKATGTLGTVGKYAWKAIKWGGGATLLLAAFAAVANPAGAAAVAAKIGTAAAADGGTLGTQIMSGDAGLFTGIFESGKIAVTEGVPFAFTEGLPAALQSVANTATWGAEGLSSGVQSLTAG